MMIDWVSAKIPLSHAKPIHGGQVISYSKHGEVEYTTYKRLPVEGSYSDKITIRSITTGVDGLGTRTLQNLRKRKKISGFYQGRKWFYTITQIKEYIQRQVGNPCAANQNSSNCKTEQESLSHPAGTLNTAKEAALSASRQGTKLARKTMKR